jgi:hypothetical protein
MYIIFKEFGEVRSEVLDLHIRILRIYRYILGYQVLLSTVPSTVPSISILKNDDRIPRGGGCLVCGYNMILNKSITIDKTFRYQDKTTQ